ncbi:MORN repeat-containing protein [Edaphocola aurantiacus]|uniref:hypothetical protein n=1 Tax=Edaphocola aurantiacus TaxID=2601682 RepID=UPI001C93BA0A|nr:hypothetical protein [Edaphocola aurantiacus]
MKIISAILSLLLLLSNPSYAQDATGKWMKDKRSGCSVWIAPQYATDSISWSGKCTKGKAEGPGTLQCFVQGEPKSQYTGMMQSGKPQGEGVYTFGSGLKLEGHFEQGVFLNLRKDCLAALKKQYIPVEDETNFYIGDENDRRLYYHALVPAGTVKGFIVLLPGTWQSTEHLISSAKAICELAYDQGIAVIVLSVNQRITLTDELRSVMNTMISDAMIQFKLPQDKCVMGGWSAGGLFSLRYTELANEQPGKTAVKPLAVFSCDGPCDIKNIYYSFQRKLKQQPGAAEPTYGIRELEQYCGGTPDAVPERYVYYSCYSHDQPEGGNARFLNKTAVRIYNDVDPVWWMENRGVDMYELNALDQTAMIIALQQMGNTQAEFINAFGKGYRIEGFRHPHSWSIIDPEELLQWIKEQLK